VKNIINLQILIFLLTANLTSALEPQQIMLIANNDVPKSLKIAEYYCSKRNVPKKNLLSLPLGKENNYQISRKDYNEFIASPIKDKLNREDFSNIKCLLTVYGVPVKIGARNPLPDKEDEKKKIKQLMQQEKNRKSILDISGSKRQIKIHKQKLSQLQQKLDRIAGKETESSLDSELSLVRYEDYELYRWQENTLRNSMVYGSSYILMVSRLDGPEPNRITELVDKALKAEKNGLEGNIYVDKGYSKKRDGKLFDRYEKSLEHFALRAKLRERYTVIKNEDENVFQPEDCPQTMLYCGWYSLKNYVDAFDFVDGAIGYHIASLEAVDLREPNSSQWCPAMLKDGITATLGAVREPYLSSFPLPDEFFSQLFNGKTLVEAYYLTKPYNSWQMVLIGDPLYTPFEKKSIFDR
jgi:uncharacterized protein (TIGR03790 family)